MDDMSKYKDEHTLKDFLGVLFNEPEATCFTDSPNGYKVRYYPNPADLFFCINPLYPDRDLNPTKEWHDKNQPRRADCNVSELRNFLIELDKLELTSQIKYVTSKIPVTSIVYSGGASYHFIVSLQDPCTSLDEYAQIAKRLLALLPEADRMCKNPSRLSRLPFRVRPETGKEQAIVYLGSRIKKTDLLAKLPELPEPRKYNLNSAETQGYLSSLLIAAMIEPSKMMADLNINSRNGLFYWAGKRMDDTNVDLERRVRIVETMYNNLEDVSDFTFEEALMAARAEGH